MVAKRNATKVDIDKVQCGACAEFKSSRDFFKSYNPLHTTGVLPYCKKCVHRLCHYDDMTINLEKLKEILRQFDRPFLYDLYETSLRSGKDGVGMYFKNLTLRQFRSLSWKDSVLEPRREVVNPYDDRDLKPVLGALERVDLTEKWGFGYSDEELYSFEKKYQLLKNNYPEQTAMHTEALLTYIRYRVKEELATAHGDVGAAQKWGDLANKAATNAKINPNQLSKADLSGGLSGFGELIRAVEQAVDIIPVLPKFKAKPQDKVDFTLWCYINYVRRMKNLPDVEYHEIYNFYEQRKKEYEQATGIDIEDGDM